MSLQDFYAEAHLDLADGFGSLAGGRKNPHRGVDVNRWPVGTPIPALYSGTVVRAEWNSALGNVVCVRTDAGFYVGYCHLDAMSVKVGQVLAVGAQVGTLGNTGSLSFGAHLHLTVSPSSDNPGVGAVVDPVPYIRAARDGKATPATPAEPIANGLSAEAQKAVQSALKAAGIYTGPVDGVFGSASVKAFQDFLKSVNLLPASYTSDGVPGPKYAKAVQSLAAQNGYTGPIDGEPGAKTSAALVTWATAFTVAHSKPAAPATPATPPTPPAPPAPTATAPTPEPTAPAQEEPIPTVDKAEQADAIAKLPTQDITGIVTDPRARRALYVGYAAVSLIVNNVATAYAAIGLGFPTWLTASMAVIGNLAVPFSALAVSATPKRQK